MAIAGRCSYCLSLLLTFINHVAVIINSHAQLRCRIKEPRTDAVCGNDGLGVMNDGRLGQRARVLNDNALERD